MGTRRRVGSGRGTNSEIQNNKQKTWRKWREDENFKQNRERDITLFVIWKRGEWSEAMIYDLCTNEAYTLLHNDR